MPFERLDIGTVIIVKNQPGSSDFNKTGPIIGYGPNYSYFVTITEDGIPGTRNFDAWVCVQDT